MSSEILPAVEGIPVAFSSIFGLDLSAEDERQIRRRLNYMSLSLRKKLRLRESPISVEDGDPLNEFASAASLELCE